MAKRYKPRKKIYTYECTLTGEEYRVTAEAPNKNDLVSVNAYYQMHPDDDDRPAVVKKRLGVGEEEETKEETKEEAKEETEKVEETPEETK